MTMVAAPVRERPILFSGEMVRAILDGRKSQTRRVVTKRIWVDAGDVAGWAKDEPSDFPRSQADRVLREFPCPYGNVGDRLWVRETFVVETNKDVGAPNYVPPFTDGRPVRRQHDEDWGDWWEQPHYAATDPKPDLLGDDDEKRLGWKPSIFMPRWASRLTLEITDVRVERLQDITDTGGMREGWRCDPANLDYLPRMWYRDLWNSLNAKLGYGWDANPWVWVIAFKLVTS